ncbi:lysophospholipid acyltransferase family protein [Marinicella sediminis]|uniref:1-acyl-sn-glycerol-3-phosphate acyltransferase n=1 Tax=Marinicella sediminis TaxID=1792834 RepID=A0ABV7J989_9GAMM|nr:lysophospholipid acyltransferase family protein [Marinicella sediminis]
MKKVMLYFYQIYVWLVVYPFAWLLTILVAMLISLLSILGAAEFAGKYIARPWGKVILWITPVMVEKNGQSNIEPHQSYVVIANHQSTYDILVVYGYLPLNFKWVMKIELRKMPFVGFACEKMGHIYVDRRNRQASIQAMRNAREQLVDGTSVFFFPEGTRSCGDQLKPFKKGAFRMAKDLQLPILPVTIAGADQVLKSGGLLITPGRIGLTFHEPIPVEQVTKLGTAQLIARCQDIIASGLTEEQTTVVTSD